MLTEAVKIDNQPPVIIGAFEKYEQNERKLKQ